MNEEMIEVIRSVQLGDSGWKLALDPSKLIAAALHRAGYVKKEVKDV